jgi:hypothetical protein
VSVGDFFEGHVFNNLSIKQAAALLMLTGDDGTSVES